MQKVGTSVSILVQKFSWGFYYAFPGLICVTGGFFISPGDGGSCEVLIFVGEVQPQFGWTSWLARNFGKRLASLFEEVAEANEWGLETLEVGGGACSSVLWE